MDTIEALDNELYRLQEELGRNSAVHAGVILDEIRRINDSLIDLANKEQENVHQLNLKKLELYIKKEDNAKKED